MTEVLEAGATPKAIAGNEIQDLGAVYKQLDAPFGKFGTNILLASTNAVKRGSAADDSRYTSISSQILSLTSQRDALADQIRTGLNNAEFKGMKLKDTQIEAWIKAAQDLIARSAALAAASS